MAEHTRVKICGITNLDDAELAAELGAWAVGLIFHKPSPRRVGEGDATAIAAALKRRTEVIGVFVNPHLDDLVATAERVGFSAIQLHGDEGPAFCSEVARRSGLKVIKAVRVATQAHVRNLGAFHTDFHLVDTYVEGLPGGTGETFDWGLLSERLQQTPLILSGGLDAANVAAGIAAAHPFAVDVASGTEAEPGRKDPARMEAFFAAVRDATADSGVAA